MNSILHGNSFTFAFWATHILIGALLLVFIVVIGVRVFEWLEGRIVDRIHKKLLPTIVIGKYEGSSHTPSDFNKTHGRLLKGGKDVK